jgi:hypothetical protein
MVRDNKIAATVDGFIDNCRRDVNAEEYSGTFGEA